MNAKFKFQPSVNETDTKTGVKAQVILPASEQEQKNEELVQNFMVSEIGD